MEFRTPVVSDELMLKDYIREHHEHGENTITAAMGLSSTPFIKWLEMIRNNVTIGNEFGHSVLFLCFDNDYLVGLLSVRFDMPYELLSKYGHIGYGVRPSMRRRGYATRMLSYGLSVCRDHGLKEVVVGCHKDNLGSAATIMKNGGILYRESTDDKKSINQYYKIAL